jgi:hypothetical protein
MSEWNVTFTDGSFVIIKDVPAGATEADVKKEISQQPKYKGKTVASATDRERAATAPGAVTPGATEAPPKKTKPSDKPPASGKKTPPDPGYKPPVYNPNADPGSKESIRQPDGTYRVDVTGTAKDEVKPSSNTSPGAQSDDVINDIVKKQEDAEKAKKAAAEADAKARKSKDDADRKEALEKQKEARIAQEKADQAKKDAEAKTTTAEPAKVATTEPAKTTTAEPAKVATTEPAKTTTAEPAKTTTAEPAKTTTAEPAKTTTAEPAKSSETEGPSLWDRIKSGAKEVGQAIGGAVTPSSTPSTEPATSTAPAKDDLKSKIEARLQELEKSDDPAVRERAKAARNKLAGIRPGPSGGADSGAKVPGPAGAPGGKVDVSGSSTGSVAVPGAGKDKLGTGPGAGTNPQGNKPGVDGPGNSQQGAPGTGDRAGTVPAAGSELDNDKIRRDRRIQDAEVERLKKLIGNKASQPGGWRDAGFGTRVWSGGPGKDPKWPAYVFNDGDIMPAASNSTGVDPKKAGGTAMSPYVGGKGSDKYDSQKTDELLRGKESTQRHIDQLKRQAGLKEDFSRILKLAGLNK